MALTIDDVMSRSGSAASSLLDELLSKVSSAAAESIELARTGAKKAAAPLTQRGFEDILQIGLDHINGSLDNLVATDSAITAYTKQTKVGAPSQ